MIIAHAAFSIAHHKKGALIVVPRGDTIVPHVTEGVLIDARLSSSVIEAIFTSTAPLHDGAVVVNDQRVLRASVVLQLATDADDNGHGTRHRAARGLAQVSDALIICVSEEHQTVSLAYGQSLEPMADELRLGAALQRLWPRKRREQQGGPPTVRAGGNGWLTWQSFSASSVRGPCLRWIGRTSWSGWCRSRYVASLAT